MGISGTISEFGLTHLYTCVSSTKAKTTGKVTNTKQELTGSMFDAEMLNLQQQRSKEAEI